MTSLPVLLIVEVENIVSDVTILLAVESVNFLSGLCFCGFLIELLVHILPSCIVALVFLFQTPLEFFLLLFSLLPHLFFFN